MQLYQQRVVDEKTDLDFKISNLRGFIGTELFWKLPNEEQARLRTQLSAMSVYSDILGERIAAFT